MSKDFNTRSRTSGVDCHETGLVTWLLPGRLGGMPRPGRSVAGIETDLEAVRDLGVSMVVTLTDEWTPPDGLFQAFGLKNLRVPIPDWQPPTAEQAAGACEEVAAELALGGSVIFHCQAGRGRTGTMLAAFLIWERPDAKAAIDRVKRANKDWIESASQMRFLEEFAASRNARDRGSADHIGHPPGEGSGPMEESANVTR